MDLVSTSSLGVTLGVFELPLPGGFDDLLGGFVLRSPFEHFPCAVAARDEAGRVSGAARSDLEIDLLTGDFFSGFDDFKDRETVAGAEVVVTAFRS